MPSIENSSEITCCIKYFLPSGTCHWLMSTVTVNASIPEILSTKIPLKFKILLVEETTSLLLTIIGCFIFG